MPLPSPPRLTVVVLTWNEARNIRACLDSLARQRDPSFEVLVLDAASTDGTADMVRAAMADFPVPLRLEVAERRTAIGEARNRGVALAKAPAVAFLSADAEADEHWVEEGLQSLRSADMVFCRQLHAPHELSIGAAVRGLRYHFPDGPTSDPLRFASNVGAAFRKEVLRAFPFDPATNAAEDLLLAKRAYVTGYHATYNPDMIVRHHDVETVEGELRKNSREGEGWGQYVGDLGLNVPVLAWGALLALAAVLFVLSPGLETLLLAGAVLWMPAVRRAWKRRGHMATPDLLLGTAASPPFDLVFLAAYVKGLLRGRHPRGEALKTKEMQA